MDEVEKFVNGCGSGEVPNVNGATCSGVGGTESDLKGSGRILWLFVDGVSNHRLRFEYKSIFTWKLVIWLVYGNPPMVPKTFIAGSPMPNML